MRILLISDVHANLEALQAVLDAAPAHDALWNLGDIVNYCASPNEVVEKLASLQSIVVRGNHDMAAAGITDLSDFNPLAASAQVWTRTVLSPANRQVLRDLPCGPVLPVSGIACVHGSPLDEGDYIESRRDAWQPLLESPAQITFFGHTHIQGGFTLEDRHTSTLEPVYRHGKSAESFVLPLAAGQRYLLNPGSVGQPRDEDWRAAFALLDLDAMQLEWHRVPYNLPETQRKIRAAGLPERLAARLVVGQ